MATTKGSSNKALGSGSLVGQESKERKKDKQRKKKDALNLGSSGSADDFVDPQRPAIAGSELPRCFGQKVLSTVPVGPSRLEVPVQFGQSNPFALPKVATKDPGMDVAAVSSPGPGTRQASYIGFGLTSVLPPGTSWGDTPYPGSLAAATMPFNFAPANRSETLDLSAVPSSSAPADLVMIPLAEQLQENNIPLAPRTTLAPDGHNESLVPGTPQKPQEGLFQYGREESPHSYKKAPLPNLTEDRMDEGTYPGVKRKPGSVRNRKSKLSRKKKEGTIDTLIFENSGSESDRTVMVEDSQSEFPVAGDGVVQEVPSTFGASLLTSCGADSIKPGDHFSQPDFSMEQTGICPWITKLTHKFFQVYKQPMERLQHMNEFLQVISAVFVDYTSRLEQFDDIKNRLDKLEAAQKRPSFSEVLGAPKFSVGIAGSSAQPSETLSVRRPPRVRKRRGQSSLTVAPVVAPLGVAAKAPPVFSQHETSVPRQPETSVPKQHIGSVPERPKPTNLLKPRQESPTVLVLPLGDVLNSSQDLKTLLENHISPKNLGLKVMACLPAAESGVMVKVQTAEMAAKL
ncbi:hypothetical protein AVEN_33616-1 [Araneus ventricosus]|uniref:Uncharacterized protein n=1 Tax=Araneus ventricosus TaxID=182803 RepID=A0A4Y2V095_ARAVE|nr:hypothetical protein AVEN_33611-1 [Araneus ventricosus]GBO17182.1 hypothetical protein AVEN_33616-1 [Araneus ventricosus]